MNVGIKKERLVLNIINYMEEYKNDFFNSHFWYKNNRIQIIWYLYEEGINKKDLKGKKYNLNTAVKSLKEHSPNLLIGEISAKDGFGVQKFFRKLESLLTSGNFEVNENSDELFFVSTFKINEEEGVKAPKKKKCCD